LGVKKRILIVDDEPSVRESMQLILSRLYDVSVAEAGERAMEMLRSAEEAPDLVLLDLMMPGIDGLSILEEICTTMEAVPVIMLTASRAVPSAVKAMKIGAVDYLNKPFDVDELLSLIAETLSSGASGKQSPSEIHTFEHQRIEMEGDFGLLKGQHYLMNSLYKTIDKIASCETTVLIQGESGTGKELVAKELHRRSARNLQPFVTVNCAAIPESLIEQELFGEQVEERIVRVGHFELAHGGTLFLDEVSALSPNAQMKILRFLERQEFCRVGSSERREVDVRILASTNADLKKLVAQGSFREDLFYRINVVSIETPALRIHKSDLKALCQHFISKLRDLYGGRNLEFSHSALDVLKGYHWPGNVRELENVVESMLALCVEDTVCVGDLPERISSEGAEPEIVEEVLSGDIDFEKAEQAFERELIIKALRRADFVQTKAAEMLGISRRILKYKMDKLGISKNSEKSKSSGKSNAEERDSNVRDQSESKQQSSGKDGEGRMALTK
jgi:DNA-binding NtrC family response regulator